MPTIMPETKDHAAEGKRAKWTNHRVTDGPIFSPPEAGAALPSPRPEATSAPWWDPD